jgi:hypothetical protein
MKRLLPLALGLFSVLGIFTATAPAGYASTTHSVQATGVRLIQPAVLSCRMVRNTCWLY